MTWGAPLNTLAEYALNQFGNLDFFDILYLLSTGSTSPWNLALCTRSPSGKCRPLTCTVDIIGQCPNPLRAPGGCLNPCQVFKTQEYCCTQGPCGPTNYSRFFKDRCRDAYSYPQDDPTSTFTCPGGTNYRVVFCPLGSTRFPLEMYGSNNEE